MSETTGHGYYERAPDTGRLRFAWPNGAQAACAIVVSAEYYEMQPPEDAFTPPNLPGGFGRGPYPDFRNYSARAYGNRVGIFRILEALDRFRVPATVALDLLTVKHCPQLLPHLARLARMLLDGPVPGPDQGEVAYAGKEDGLDAFALPAAADGARRWAPPRAFENPSTSLARPDRNGRTGRCGWLQASLCLAGRRGGRPRRPRAGSIRSAG